MAKAETIKREPANRSLRAAMEKSNRRPERYIYIWAKKRFLGITRIYISKEDVINHEKTFVLVNRYLSASM